MSFGHYCFFYIAAASVALPLFTFGRLSVASRSQYFLRPFCALPLLAYVFLCGFCALRSLFKRFLFPFFHRFLLVRTLSVRL